MSVDEAIELADLLLLRHNVAAARVETKIRAQARRGAFAQKDDVALDESELVTLCDELDAVLEQPGWAESSPAYVHLRDELARHLGR